MPTNKKPGRKPSPTPLLSGLAVRLTASDRETLQHLADTLSLERTTALRRLLRSPAARRALISEIRESLVMPTDHEQDHEQPAASSQQQDQEVS